MRRPVDFIVFIIIVIISLFLPYLKYSITIKYLIAFIPVFLAVYLFFTNLPLFVPSLFFSINSLFSPLAVLVIERFNLYIPQIYFMIPIIIYLLIVLNSKSLKSEITWLKWGKLDRTSLVLIILMIIVSAAALYVWTLFFKSEIDKFQKFIPNVSITLLIAYGLLFPLFNSLFEEFMARAVLYDGFAALCKNISVVIAAQACIFSLWHYGGFPGGIFGVIMVFIWSIFLGIIRFRTQGMLPVIIAHYCADLTIAVILLFFVVIPKGIGF